jgi:hypothetical protein
MAQYDANHLMFLQRQPNRKRQKTAMDKIHGSTVKVFEQDNATEDSRCVMEATPPATPRHTMFPLWLLPSGSDQVHG